MQAVAGALQGLGVSPETTGLVGAIGFASSTHPLDLSFDLEDLARPGLLIEHDCSMSREDYKIGNNNDYNGTTWGVTLKAFKNKEKMGAFEFGKGKSDRIEDAKKRNPKSAYGPRAAAFGAIEIGMVMSAFGAVGPVKTSWVRSLFEHERLPTHLGWKVSPLSDNAAFALGQGAISLTADSKLIQHLGDVVLSTPQVCCPNNFYVPCRRCSYQPNQGHTLNTRRTLKQRWWQQERQKWIRRQSEYP